MKQVTSSWSIFIQLSRVFNVKLSGTFTNHSAIQQWWTTFCWWPTLEFWHTFRLHFPITKDNFLSDLVKFEHS